MLPGDGLDVSKVALAHPDLAGIHFTGSTPTFQHLWQTIGTNISGYRSYPRIVGETGGKDFILAHPSADPDVLRVAMIRGAFEYQGQKCSAASRAYVPRSVWDKIKDQLIADTEDLSMGDVTDLSHFMGAVIDDRAFAKHKAAIARAKPRERPRDRRRRQGRRLGRLLRAAHDRRARPTRPTRCSRRSTSARSSSCTSTTTATSRRSPTSSRAIAPYALTGAVIARTARRSPGPSETLRFAAGNFYINDKPTGAVVGQQPFGGGRAVGHQRQGRRRGQPAALDLAALHQGDVRAADRLPLPATMG